MAAATWWCCGQDSSGRSVVARWWKAALAWSGRRFAAVSGLEVTARAGELEAEIHVVIKWRTRPVE
jgi:hypothetical protein